MRRPPGGLVKWDVCNAKLHEANRIYERGVVMGVRVVDMQTHNALVGHDVKDLCVVPLGIAIIVDATC